MDFLRGLLDYIPDRIYFKDLQGRFVLVSKSEADYLGAKNAADVVGKTDFDYFDKELAQAAFDDEQEVMRTGKAMKGKVEEKLLLDGRTGWALVAKIPMRDAAGVVIGTCGISKDVTRLRETQDSLHEALSAVACQKNQLAKSLTDLNKAHQELKTAQEQLIDFQKLQGLARLAFGAAHEIRNPLATLELGIGFLSSQSSIMEEEAASDALQGMSEAITRAEIVIRALMDGATATGVTLKPGEASEIVRQAVEKIKSEKAQPTTGS
ncbi:PAS domain-containing protein [Prosthecobacter sp.]|uniref:PAS domain-containing protein n=1 Tax=Prosthecobacter sp. TaxID=1965333 RepID=UPI001E0F2F39|nr:PAS domain-containing protein [Prosthecobacter sp.]MCB1279141.1 PAS domain-containing protein [Prosthecobacter sp.]